MAKGGGYIKIDGMEEIRAVLNEVAPRHARNIMRATIYGIAAGIAKDAKKIAPVDTGALKKAIKARRAKSHPDKPVSEVYVQSGKGKNPDAFYWRFVEYGTKDKADHPFIRPATDAAKATINDRMQAEFGKRLEKALAKAKKK